MSVGGFQRVTPLGDGFIRGPARLLIAPYSEVWPTSIGSIVNLEEEGSWKNEKQTISKFAEAPETGTFYLGFGSYPTTALTGSTVTGEQIAAALEALPTIGPGGIKITSTKTKKLSEEEFKFEFEGELKNHAQPLVQVLRNTCKKGANVQALTVTRAQAGFGLYDPVGSWTELGATKGGVKIMRNNTESLLDIDQTQAAIGALPDEWEMTIEAPLAETTNENIRIAWEGADKTTEFTSTIGNQPNESHLGFGNPLEYAERRMAVIHRKTLGTSQGKFVAFVFRRALRSAAASTIDFQKTGNMATIACNFKAFADTTVADPKKQMGEKFDQNYF